MILKILDTLITFSYVLETWGPREVATFGWFKNLFWNISNFMLLKHVSRDVGYTGHFSRCSGKLGTPWEVAIFLPVLESGWWNFKLHNFASGHLWPFWARFQYRFKSGHFPRCSKFPEHPEKWSVFSKSVETSSNTLVSQNHEVRHVTSLFLNANHRW